MTNDGSGYRIAGPRSGRSGARITARIRRDGAKLADPNPDQAGTDITGGWEGSSVGVRINRAGTHIEGWHTDYRSKVVTAFAGDAAAQEIFALWDSPGYLSRLGTLSVVSDNELALSWGNQPSEALRRIDRQVALSDNALKAFDPSQRQSIIDEQRQPLSTSDRKTIMDGVSARVLGPFIDRYYAMPCSTHTEQAKRALVVQEVDRHVWQLFHRLHSSDQRKGRPWAMLVLRRTQHAVGGKTQPLLVWLQEMAQVASILGSDPVPSLRDQLNITPNARLHHYQFFLNQRLLNTSELADLVATSGRSLLSLRPGLGGGYYGGTIRVRELIAPNEDAASIWETTYPVSIAQLGLGLGFSFGSDNDAIVSTTFPWQAQNFPGPIKIVDLSIGGGEYAWGATGAFFSGDRTYPELIVDFSGKGTNLGISAGLTEAIGSIGAAHTAKPEPFSIPTETPYVAASSRAAVHFPFGQAELTPEGRQILRIFAAQELALFRAGYAKLLIESHADRVDSKDYNELLTKCRSWNSYQALQDILGSSMHHSTERRLLGLGETGAETAGDKDNLENPTWRRSDVYINGRLVVRLRGEGQSVTR